MVGESRFCNILHHDVWCHDRHRAWRTHRSTRMTTAERTKWLNIDGMLHIAGDCPSCSITFSKCKQCGAGVHYQPLYGGYVETCEACETWETGPLPPHDDGIILTHQPDTTGKTSDAGEPDES